MRGVSMADRGANRRKWPGIRDRVQYRAHIARYLLSPRTTGQLWRAGADARSSTWSVDGELKFSLWERERDGSDVDWNAGVVRDGAKRSLATIVAVAASEDSYGVLWEQAPHARPQQHLILRHQYIQLQIRVPPCGEPSSAPTRMGGSSPRSHIFSTLPLGRLLVAHCPHAARLQLP